MRTLIAFLFLLLAIGCNNDPRLEIPEIPEDQLPATAQDFEGSQTCSNCHRSIYESWDKTTHNRIVREATLARAINDADGNGVNDFQQGGAGATFDVGTSVASDRTDWDEFALGAGVTYPRLGYDGANLLVRIGANTYPVTWIAGGNSATAGAQRYLVTLGHQEYAVAVQYDPEARRYAVYEVGDWYTLDAGGGTLTGFVYAAGEHPADKGNAGNSFQRRHLGHAVTGLFDVTKNADGEYGDTLDAMREAGSLSELNAACEACHGPAARHVDLGGGIGTALNPATMAANRADETCGQCHSRGESANAERFGYPWREGDLEGNGFRPGNVLAEFQDTPPRTDAKFFWTNGARSARLSQQQWTEHVDSAHARAGVTCWQCHAPHGSSEPANLRMPVQQLCLSCHDGQGDIDSADLSKHTRHPEASVQNCTNCHFVKTAQAGEPNDTRSHTYRVIFPAESAATEGLPNSCGECHGDKTPEQLTSWLRARWPQVRPVAYPRAAKRSSGGYTLLGIDSLDPLDAPLSFQWRFVSGPSTFMPSDLIAPTGENAIFVPAQPGIYTFTLVVTTADGRRSHEARITVDVDQGVDQNPPDLTQARYMGSSGCRICHSDVHDDWLGTRHSRTLRRVGGATGGELFADSNGNGINDWVEGGNPPSFDLADDPFGNRTQWDDFDYDGADAPLIGYDEATNTYKVRIGEIVYDVTHVTGGTGRWYEQYLVRIDEGDYVLPLAWSDLGSSWDARNLPDWYVVDGDVLEGHVYEAGETPATQGRAGTDSFQVRCIACHVTGLREMTRDTMTGEYGKALVTMHAASTGPRFAELGVGCESCHGPGSEHMPPSTGGEGSPSTRGAIMNPSKMPSDRAGETCGQCHAQGTSVNSGKFRYPWGSSADAHFIPGQVLGDFFKFPDENDESYFWSDPQRHARLKYMQWLDFRTSPHSAHAGLRCTDCHTSHDAGDGAQLRTAGNQLCLRCHQSIVDDEGRDRNHSRHANTSRGNSCFGCHMPFTAVATREFDIRSHAFDIIYPVTSTQVLLSEGEGIPNSCATSGCHTSPLGGLPGFDPSDDEDNEDLTALITNVFGDLRPIAAPRVDAGGLRRTASVEAPATIQLDGTQSYDPNGTAIATYTWTLVSAPAGNVAFLLDRFSARPRINVTVAGEYVFQLVVKDATQSSRARTVTVEVTE